MPAAAARGRRTAGASSPRAEKRLGRPRKSAATQRSLEHRILITATLCLLAFGAVMVYSSSSATTLLKGHGYGSGYLVKYLVYGAVGLIVMRVLARDGVSKVQSITAPLLVVSFVLVVAVHIPHVGVSVNGARRWIGPGQLQFQPSELMKLALVLYSATLLARRPQRVHDLRELAKPLLFVVGAACLLVFTQPDLGTAMVIAFTVSALLVAAGIPMRKLAMMAAGVLGIVLLYALVRPYARARLTSFLDPWAHASSSGFQAVQGQIAIGSGGMFGVGPGQSVQKIFYLPEAPTDFILAVIAEELGVVGVCALLFLYGLIGYAGLRAAKAARSLYSALIAVGVTALILSQAILNIFAVLGIAPLTGVPLPFVSYGSSSLIVMLAAMGLLLNVAAGATGHVRAVAPARGRSDDTRARESARWGGERSADEDRDRRRRDRRARGAGAGGGRSAAG
ncbi:MAG: cell division protein FtsW [Solirubrobacterales bacterium]|jgi:cell division protein FtsW|nr:cell division protein FtsW [Solirubrobacterales bacterium]MCW3026439.1 cell division protein FtsW [Solirubrobacterales bacterium]